MVKEVYANITNYRQALIDAGVKPITEAEHIGTAPCPAHPQGKYTEDKDGVEHWRLPCHKINEAGDVALINVGFWKDTLGRLGQAGSIYPDRLKGAYNSLKPVEAAEDTTSLGVRALAKASEIAAVWSAWLIDSKSDCVIVGCYQEVDGNIEKKVYAVRAVGETLEIKPYIEVVA